MADIWDAPTAVLYRDAELTPQYNVPGDATVGSCTYFGPEMPINETQIPPTVEAFPYKKGTIVIQHDPRAPLVADDIRSIRAAAGLPTERPEVHATERLAPAVTPEVTAKLTSAGDGVLKNKLRR
ncbi:hypothetical protein [Rhodococcus sp. NPDC055024]